MMARHSPYLQRTPPKAFHERLNWGLRQEHDELAGGFGDLRDELAGMTGWVTLVKDGRKLVTSRLRLDCISRNEQVNQWARRMQNNKGSKSNAAALKKGVPLRESEKNVLAGNGPTLPIAFELANDPASFAYGGLFPGTVHSHGKLHPTHRVSYSIGVSGQYLLHVRLRKQAAALPGSPFVLTVQPGPAYALASRLPSEPLATEVGDLCSTIITTADKMGNPRSSGGDLSKFELTSKSELLKSNVDDLGDGSYKLSWTCESPGEYQVHVKIGGEDIVNSPMKLSFGATIPVYERSELFGPVFERTVAAQRTSLVIKLVDQFGNPAHPDEDYKSSTWNVGMALINNDDMRDLKEGELPLYNSQGQWLPGG